MTKYKLIFNGQIIEGSNKNSCIEGLAKLFNKTPDIIEKKLFSGKKIVIKITTDQVVVDYYVNAFKSCGGRLLVKYEFMGKTDSAAADAESQDRKSSTDNLPVKTIKKKKFGKSRLKIRLLSPKKREKGKNKKKKSVAAVVGILIVVGLTLVCFWGYFYNQKALLPLSSG